MKKIDLSIRLILTLLVGLAVWTFWLFAYPAHLHFHEQLQLFEFTKDYACDVLVKPAGVAEYLSRFLVQFFYDAKIGALMLAVVFALLFNALVILFRKSDNDAKLLPSALVFRYSLALVPVVMVSAFLVGLDAKLTMPIALLLTLYAVWITERIHSKRVLLPVAALFSVFLAFTVGSVFIVYTSLVFGRSALRKFYSRNWKWGLAFLFAGLLVWLAIVLILPLVYPYPSGVLTWGDYYNRFVFVKADLNVLSWGVAIAVGLLFANVRAFRIEYLTPLVLVGCIYFVSDRYSEDEESLLDNIYNVRLNRWDDIIAKYHGRTPVSEYELTGLNLALAMKGQLADSYFHYPQKGTEGLLPVYKMDYMTPLLSAEAYYQMGMINTSQRFYYESMEGIADHQKSAFCLQRLTMTALANGRANLAKGYLHKLRNTLYYSDWADEMQKYADNPKLIDSHPELARLRKQRTRQDSFFDDENQPPFIAEMLNFNPDNTCGWQYLFTMLMAKGRLDELMQTAQFYSKHFPGNMLPVHVQEALLYSWLTKTGSLDGFPWKVAVNIGQRFMEFAKEANQPRQVAEPIVRQRYSDTFWCYAVFAAQKPNTDNPRVDGSTGASRQDANPGGVN